MANPCRICGGAVQSWLSGLHDDRYGYPGSFSLEMCGSCGHRQLDARFDAQALRALYTDYYPRSSFDLDSWRADEPAQGPRAWLAGAKASAFRWVPSSVRVLDIGCGFGQSLGYHKARGCDVYGVEADENIRRVADRHGFNVQVGLFDAGLYAEGFFDVVTLDQVIEHAVDPVAMLKGVARVLNPAGTAILSTPNPEGWGAKRFGRRWINWHAPYHLHQFSERSMADAARRAGFEVVRRLTCTASEWLYYQWLHLGADPEPGKPHPFWSEKGRRTPAFERAEFQARVWRCLRGHQVLTRWYDALGQGDNQLFFLRRALATGGA